MMVKLLIPLVVIVTWLAGLASAQVTVKGPDGKKVKISVAKGDAPPPGPIAKLTPPIARVIVRDLLNKREMVNFPDSCIACGVPFLETKTWGVAFFETKNIRLNRDKLAFDVDELSRGKRKTVSPVIDFTASDYVNVSGKIVYSNSKGAVIPNLYILQWVDPQDAERFAQALNLLIFEGHKAAAITDDLAAFEGIAKNWRENPGARPQPSDEMTRQRILAEQAIKDKDLVKALIHYEQGLETFPTWPEGWFNAAFLYGELGEFEGAASRMRRYLALTPDAPDAAAAREKVIIWEDKARRN